MTEWSKLNKSKSLHHSVTLSCKFLVAKVCLDQRDIAGKRKKIKDCNFVLHPNYDQCMAFHLQYII
jgi:hypothetical protein